MKKPVNKIENPSLAITATLTEPYLIKNLVEELAERRTHIGYCLEKVEPGWLSLETSSLEANVSGDTNLFTQTDLIKIGFTTCFLFTCTKAKGQDYNLAWVRSLS